MPIEAAMGPVSILTIAEVVATSITELVNLKLRDRSVPLQVSTLVGQLHIVQVALEQILSWTSEDLLNSQRYQQLVAQIEGSLGSFCPLILALQEHLDRLSLRDQGDMTARSKVSFFWNEKDLASYSSLLDRQANALSLFLQAVQWYVSRKASWGATTALIDGFFAAGRWQNNSVLSTKRKIKQYCKRQEIVAPPLSSCSMMTRVSSQRATSTLSASSSTLMP